MTIKRLKNAKFGNENGVYTLVTGWALYVEGKGYVAYESTRNEYGFNTPYIPQGGKKALQAIIDFGGFTSFDGMEYVNIIK